MTEQSLCVGDKRQTERERRRKETKRKRCWSVRAECSELKQTARCAFHVSGLQNSIRHNIQT